MGKKGKGKDPTKGMTEEEKIAFLQQKAVEEEQAKAQTAVIAMQFLTDKLHKEEKAVRLNETKLITKWRDILRNSKSEELKKDIQILSQTFERMVDKKNALVEALVYSALKLVLRPNAHVTQNFTQMNKCTDLLIFKKYSVPSNLAQVQNHPMVATVALGAGMKTSVGWATYSAKLTHARSAVDHRMGSCTLKRLRRWFMSNSFQLCVLLLLDIINSKNTISGVSLFRLKIIIF